MADRRQANIGPPNGVERRKPGRPRVDEARSSVSTWVPSRLHDRLIKLANHHDMSVSALLRHIVILQLQRAKTPEADSP